MCLADSADYGYARSVETEEEYALREAQQFLHNRGFELLNQGAGWQWSLRGQPGQRVESKELCIISAFVHHAHNNRKL